MIVRPLVRCKRSRWNILKAQGRMKQNKTIELHDPLIFKLQFNLEIADLRF